MFNYNYGLGSDTRPRWYQQNVSSMGDLSKLLPCYQNVVFESWRFSSKNVSLIGEEHHDYSYLNNFTKKCYI